MTDHRVEIVAAGLKIVREEGLGGLTQPKVAARAGLRHSHLTYYFAKRSDLLMAVARAAADRQLELLDTLLKDEPMERVPQAIAALLDEADNVRVILALVQGADQEPVLRTMFRQLAVDIRSRVSTLIQERTGKVIPMSSAHLIYALSVGLAVVGLGANDPDDADTGKAAALSAALGWVVGTGQAPPGPGSDRREPASETRP